MTTPPRRWLSFTLRTLFVVALILGACLVCLVFVSINNVSFLPTKPPGVQFDARVWREADPSKDRDRTMRGSMVDDLIVHKLLDRLTRTQIEDLLGTPTGESTRKSAGMDDPHWHMSYHLGPTRDVPIDEEFLMIRFDDEGRAIEYRVIPN